MVGGAVNFFVFVCATLAANDGPQQRPLNVTDGEELRSEFLCPSLWQNWEHMREKIVAMLEGEKIFIRFRTPVRGYSNPHLGLEDWSGYLTWVWVAEKFQYMLYYPHNFETLSLATTNIVCADLEERHIQLSCGHCSNNASCGIGMYELQALMANVTASVKMDWKYLCFEADYGMEDIVSDYVNEQSLQMLNTRNFAVPDILYQWCFLRRLFTLCPTQRGSCIKANIHNYYCYDRNSNFIFKELMQKYYVIVLLAVIMWFFSPLLTYYLPSSPRDAQLQTDMFPTYKQPVHFGRCIQYVLGYYMTKSCKWLVRVRRVLTLLVLASLSFRLLISSAYQSFSWIILVTFIIAILHPHYLSVYIQPEIPKCFPLFTAEYPPGVIKWNPRKEASREYQRLAYVMQERIFIISDWNFWEYLLKNCFSSLLSIRHQFSHTYLLSLMFAVVAGLITLACALLILILYFFLPMPYFVKEMFCAIRRGEWDYCVHVWESNDDTLSKIYKTIATLLQGIVLVFLLFYFVLTMFSLSYLVTEVALFTYIGANITPHIALHYVALVAALGSALYGMTAALHKEYTSILDDMVDVLSDDKGLAYIRMKMNRCAGMKLALIRNEVNGVHTQTIRQQQPHMTLYYKEGFVSYVHTKLYFYIVECLQPVRRQVLFLAVKILGMVFFIMVAMWVKNVYKSESKVSDIFSLAGDVGVYFIPSALQFLSYRSHLGRKAETQQKIEVADEIVTFIEQQSDEI